MNSTSAESFLDANVPVHAVDAHGSEPVKRDMALMLIARENFGTSSRVLQEFYVTVTRKGARPLPPSTALEWIEQLEAVPWVAFDVALIKLAIEASVRHEINYWDATLIVAAEALGAKTLYTEDLSSGQTYGSVRVENPFLNISQVEREGDAS